MQVSQYHKKQPLTHSFCMFTDIIQCLTNFLHLLYYGSQDLADG